MTPAQTAPFDVTKYWKASNVRIKLVIKASPFYSGSLVFGMAPLDSPPSMKKLINIGAQIYKISKDESVEYDIPWRFTKGYLDVAKERMGTFVIYVLTPLRTGPDNPSSISISMYVAMEENKFKLPEVLPISRYTSYKFDSDYIMTRPQASQPNMVDAERTARCVTDINEPVSKIYRESTMLCAGKGLVGVPDVAHYQDSPSNLIQLLKRWRTTDLFRIDTQPDAQYTYTISYSTLTDVASSYLSNLYSTWRGSIGLRVSVFGANSFEGTISYAPIVGERRLGNIGENCGIHRFDQDSVGQVTIPYFYPTFISKFFKQEYEPKPPIVVTIQPTQEESRVLYVRFEVALGDDFHVGMFTGSDRGIIPIRQKLKPNFVATETPYILSNTKTRPQGGVFEFLGRAVENILPVAETVSELGSLLDAHMITQQPDPVSVRRLPYSIPTDIHRFTERLLTTNHNGMSLPDKECFGNSKDEADMYNLLTETKSFYGLMNWKDTADAGTELKLNSVNLLLPGPTGDTSVMHDNISSLFHFWTGSTTYIFDIVATEMHRGQLIFAYTFDETPLTYENASQTYFTTFDLSAGRGTLAVTLPYLSPRPYTNVFSGSETDAHPTTVGQLHVFVQNPLRSSQTVAPQVDIVVYKTYGPDYRLMVYGNDHTLPKPE